MTADRFKESQELSLKHRENLYQEIEKLKTEIGKIEGYIDQQEKMIEEIKDGQNGG